jgi:hypothetical protein
MNDNDAPLAVRMDILAVMLSELREEILSVGFLTRRRQSQRVRATGSLDVVTAYMKEIEEEMTRLRPGVTEPNAKRVF